MILILILIRSKNLKRSLGQRASPSVGEVGAEPRGFYGRAVSATASLTAKYVACGWWTTIAAVVCSGSN
jgi:hypothetical protein